MVARLPVVEQLLGAPLAEVTSQHLASVIERRLPEGPDLDFKAEHYGSSDKDKAELAKDVSAFANHVGGVLILGIGDVNGVASPCDRIELSDSLHGGMLQTLRGRLAPFVPELDILPVREDGRGGLGYYLIVVGRSPRAPHAIVIGGPAKPLMQWPVRQGTSTRFLHEAELAEAYRDRFEGATRRFERLTCLMTEGAAPLNRQAGGWVSIGLVPALPGVVPLGVEGIRQTQEIAGKWAESAWGGGVLWERFALNSASDYAVRVRRVVFDPDFVNNRPPQTAYIECHSDGSCVASTATRIKRSPKDKIGHLPQEWVEAVVLELLHFVSFYSLQARSGGEIRLRMKLLLPPDVKVAFALNESQWQLADVDDLNVRDTVQGELTLPDITVTLGDLVQPVGMARVAYLLVQDLLAAFAIPKGQLLTADGAVSSDVRLNGIQEWAEQAGLGVSGS